LKWGTRSAQVLCKRIDRKQMDHGKRVDSITYCLLH
jgi:hypothetical protein